MFFDQIKEIDGSIRKLHGDLKNIGVAAEAQFDQIDNLAGHIIALEAIVCVLLTKVEVDGEAVKAWIKENTAETSENEEGSEKVHMIAQQLLTGEKMVSVEET